jgi:hypothetical protein
LQPNGTRRISGQLFSPPDTVGALSSASSTATELAPAHPDLQVPLNLYSVHTFEFIGFTTKASEHLLKRWTSEDDQTLEHVITTHVQEFCDDMTADWRASMKKLGISGDIQARIMDPNFTDVRCAASLLFWILELVSENLWTLENWSERLNRNLAIIKSGPQQFPSLRDGAPQNRSHYQWTQPGNTTLFRATSAAKLVNTLQPDSLRLDKMCFGTVVPSDFSLDRTAYYWSTEYWVSERFAAYTANIIRAPANVCIIRALLPRGLLEGKNVWKVNFSDDWKKLVWYSRNGEPYPIDIQKKWDESKLIIGPVSINVNGSFQKMKSWKDVSESNTFRVGPEEGMQHVWIGAVAMAQMNEPFGGKMGYLQRPVVAL